MSRERSSFGLLCSAIGGIVLAVSVFLPWYGLSLTKAGAVLTEQISTQAVSEYGNAQLQAQLAGLHSDLSSIVGHSLSTVSAHQALKNVNVLLLIIAAAVIVLSLAGLARSGRTQSDGERTLIVLVGLLALACVAYRMIHPPLSDGGIISLSLGVGCWLSLVSSIAIFLGGLWPSAGGRVHLRTRGSSENVFSELSGWTPSS